MARADRVIAPRQPTPRPPTRAHPIAGFSLSASHRRAHAAETPTAPSMCALPLQRPSAPVADGRRAVSCQPVVQTVDSSDGGERWRGGRRTQAMGGLEHPPAPQAKRTPQPQAPPHTTFAPALSPMAPKPNSRLTEALTQAAPKKQTARRTGLKACFHLEARAGVEPTYSDLQSGA